MTDAARRGLRTRWRETLLVWAYAAWKIPLLAYLRPRVLELSTARCVVRLRLGRRTKNHLGSMYFGALATGADAVVGLLAMHAIRARKAPVRLVFRELRAEFLRPGRRDVELVCEQGAAIAALVEQAIATGERCDLEVAAWARLRDDTSEDPVARFVLTLSLKRARRRG